MDDRVFDLLEKVYIELQDTKKVLGNHIMRLENEFHDKIGVVSDEVSIIRKDISIIKEDIEVVKEKVETHDIKIQVIEGGKKKTV